MKKRLPNRIPLALIVVISAGALVGCGGSTDGQPTPESTGSVVAAQPVADDCAVVSAPMASIDPRGTEEPQLRIPTPAGWERNTTLDSELIRYVMTNQDLVADSFAPNVVVTLERVAGTSMTPQDILEQQRTGLETTAGATDMEVTPTTVCGATAETVEYTLPAQGQVAAHPAMVLSVAAPYGGNTWSATVTVQAINADDPTYESDTSTILTGFQMVPQGTS